jgi:stearoyl-CoA desaturase (delta-9 desaturase)
MFDALLSFLDGGLTGATWPWLLLYFAIAAQFTIFSVTLYLHRCQAHRGVDLHGLVSHPFRLWLWMSTGMNTKEWVAIHRKHHARCETPDDPHSPQFHGIGKVVVHGVALYTEASRDKSTMEQFGHGTPDDWIENKVYRHNRLGPAVLLVASLIAFGVAGVAVWALQMLVIPILAAGVVNGLGHWWGYRNFDTEDRSHNLTPWGLLLGGEELHNNHHAFPSSARFALRRGEFDIGWFVLRCLSVVGLARIRRVAPVLERHEPAEQADHETLRAVLVHRFQVMTDYFRNVIVPVVHEEAERAGASLRRWRRQARQALAFQNRLKGADQHWFASRPTLNTVWEFRQRLRSLYERRGVGGEHLLKALQEWCHDAEATGIRALQQFAARLKGYRLAPASVGQH